ncbi:MULTISPECIES: hypothetical protein [Weeksella]|uniref:hypothetical protein n=1 Tax=Weeksella TaxID=1013 RepID=UPI0008A195E6|nr:MULTISPECIES: hypothetical protein [Weeksella]MDK7375257.1 hypothetical protein [Weeksella virosa]OFM85632.1 hypothetical protein HMPREF2660_06800 [Weeksella sp. HMSC059D05]
MKIFYCILFTFLAIISQAQTNDNDSVVVVKQYLNIDNQYNYKITTYDTRTEGLDTIQKEYLSYKVSINVLDLYQDQYTLHWRITNIENSKKQISKNPLSILDEIDIYYSVDSDGKFLGFQTNNWTMVQFYTALENAEDDYADNSEVLKTLAEMEKQYATADKLNSLFEKEIKQFHYFFGLGNFTVNSEPKVYKTYLDNLFNPNPTPAITTYSLREISPYLGNYVMISSSVAEEEWLKESWFNYLEKIAKEMKVDAPDRSTIDDNIIYTVDTMSRIKENGWPSYCLQSKKVYFQNTEFTQKRVIEILP